MSAEANEALVQRWAELFNDDVEALVAELYSPACQFSGAPMSQEKLLKFERRVLAAAPRRAIRLGRVHTSGDDVAVAEGVLVDPDQGDDWELAFCAVLTVDGGKIVSDNTYADYSRWPGMR